MSLWNFKSDFTLAVYVTSRYDITPDIYPWKLLLNKANTSNKETSFLDLNIKVIGSKFTQAFTTNAMTLAVCMYVCMPVISSYLGAPCPTPRGDRTGTNEPHYRSGEGGSEAFTVWINVGFPSTYVQVKDRPLECGPATKIRAKFPTPRHQNHKDPLEVHDHDRNNHWKGYQSIQWRPWNQAVFRWTKNRSARRKNHRISQGDSLGLL